LPSLLRAHEIGMRVAAVGFDWARTTDVVDKIEEEVAELRGAVQGEGRERVEEEMGDLLFSIANLARKLGIEPESALRKANEKFSARFDNAPLPGKEKLAVVTFEQDYSSSNLANRMRKRQYWLKEGPCWRIIHEGAA